MSGKVKAIETIYNDYRFRSRLEARWAVFMDELDIEYRYEPEGFELDGIRYLPDFYLPQLQCWLEIKPDVPTNEEREKVIKLCIAQDEPVIILTGEPWSDIVGYGFIARSDENRNELTKMILSDGDFNLRWITNTECITYNPSGWMCFFDINRGYAWSLAQWNECTECHVITISALGTSHCQCGTSEYNGNKTPRLMKAYTAARQARFEFGR